MLIGSWWLLWLVFMFVLFLTPIGYGWGYRGWGPPYPRYIQRRRAQNAATSGGPTTFNHHAWGWRGDVVWTLLLIGVLWACLGMFRR
jgi:hypothetical protein